MDKRDIIVIGASAGGFDALKQFVEHLPKGFDASIFIVWHMSPDIRGILPHVLNKSGKLTAAHAIDGEPVMLRRIYIAPPDHHLLLEHGRVRVTHGPKENGFRPSVDPLFRSAALAYGSRVIGIVLSGALDDGASGLWAIKQQGGITIVQDPSDAEVPSMPINAIRAVNVDYIVPVDAMGTLLVKLIEENIVPGDEPGGIADEKRAGMEVSIAMEEKNSKQNILEYGELSEFTCPECHGVLAALYEGNRIRFRCHTGHAFSADSLLAGITENIEETLWAAIRSIQESVFLLNHLGDHFSETNQPRIAATYFKKAKKAAKRADLIRQAVFDHEQLNTDSIEKQPENR